MDKREAKLLFERCMPRFLEAGLQVVSEITDVKVKEIASLWAGMGNSADDLDQNIPKLRKLSWAELGKVGGTSWEKRLYVSKNPLSPILGGSPYSKGARLTVR